MVTQVLEILLLTLVLPPRTASNADNMATGGLTTAFTHLDAVVASLEGRATPSHLMRSPPFLQRHGTQSILPFPAGKRSPERVLGGAAHASAKQNRYEQV
ncbi:hypothetical protein DENSPDRAFT_846442 [Dentipellis sp. KUC8613]|nr:hypothetical protein DENSPDRAFT_846442 [Dentipellis sp. KUC8613]